MLVLLTTLDKIQVVTTGSAAIGVHASYIDWDGKVSLPGRKNTIIASATTTDVVLGPTFGISRSIGFLSVRNVDSSSSNGITVQHTDGTTVAILKDFTVNAQEGLYFSESQGWQRFLRNGALATVGRNAYSFQPANPASTSSTTLIMMGFGSTCQITPSYGNRFYMKVIGFMYHSFYENVGIYLMYATGTPPVYGAAITGNIANSKYHSDGPYYTPFAMSSLISNLTLNTVYWLDIAIYSSGGHSTAIQNIQIVAFET